MKFLAFLCCMLVSHLLESHAVIWPCTSKEDCVLAKDSDCSARGVCECERGYLLSENLSRCVKSSLYGEECEESIQCTHLASGAKCKKGFCECDDGFNYIRGRCRKFSVLNGACVENEDCYFGYDRESVTCENKFCKCSNGYYERSTNICRRKANVGDACVVNADCQQNGVKCVSFKCENDSGQKIAKDIGIQTSIEGLSFNSVSTNINKYETDAKVDIKGIFSYSELTSRSVVGDDCSNYKEQCAGLENSLCANGQCVCKLGFYEEGGVCYAELGEHIDNETLCKTVYNAEKKLCTCPTNFFYEPGLRECKKPIVPVEGRCTSNSQCSPFGASYCRTERPRICQCYNYAKYNDSRQLCTVAEGLGAYCEDNSTCQLANTVCSNEKLCVCKQKFVENNGVCLPSIGAECHNDEECVAANSICDATSKNSETESASNVCRCQKGFVPLKEMCMKEVEKDEEDCADKDQCKPLLGDLAQCVNSKCTCSDENHLNNGKCHEKKMLGDSCHSKSDCFAEENQAMVECRNEVCRCQFGYNTDIERRICIVPKKSSSGRPSPLKVITLLLIASAFLITSAAIKEAYF